MATIKKKEAGMIAHARKELELLGETPEVITAYLKVIKAFVDMDHSGSSACISVPVINALLLQKNLTPLTDDPKEWMLVPEEKHGVKNMQLWQSTRCPDAFSTTEGKSYYLLSEGAHFHNQRPVHGTKITEPKND